jgi:hypothetical protein
MDFRERFLAAKRVSIPLVSLITASQPDAMKLIARLVNPPKANGTEPGAESPVISWDVLNGAAGFNKAGLASLDEALATITRAKWNGEGDPPEPMDQKKTTNPIVTLQVMQYMAPMTVLVMQNGHNYFGIEPNRSDGSWAYAQALLNLRDPNKETGRMVVICGPDFGNIPKELATDIFPLEEPMPTVADLTKAMTEEVAAWNLSMPKTPIEIDDATMTRAVDNMRGIESSYMAQQTIAMSITRRGIDPEELWQRNQQLINSCPGLRVWPQVSTFRDLEGYDEAKGFGRLIANGKKPVRTLILIDEGEKQLKGADGTDGSSVTVEMVSNVLTEMQDREYEGLIGYGPPGAGKSAFFKALAGEFNLRLIYQDFSGAKGKYVGESNANLRRQYRVINAVSGGAPLFCMTVNAMTLSTPLLRRFTYGTMFFDLPTDAELQKIWALYMRKYELVGQEIPECKRWTGADVERCVKLSWSLGIPLTKAKQYIIPVAVSAKKEIESVRLSAVGKYLSASYPGLYKGDTSLPKRKDGGRTYQDTPNEEE